MISDGIKAILNHFAIYSYSIAFPELHIAFKLHIKRLLKTVRLSPTIRGEIQKCLKLLEQNNQFVVDLRSTGTAADLAPKDIQVWGSERTGIRTFQPTSKEGAETKKKQKGVQISPLERSVTQQKKEDEATEKKEAEEAERDRAKGGKKKIGRAVQQECRDRSRMPSSA
eukprot:TRINITY_DN5908_c0_g2_i2.p1 TRINITY_DN5908_c0_g2~~TRINITY_DN5908_c0_g2_i2.p1  ORF type:complete len:169 (+),score=30.51 TRINITY_DN5908_c0_g2_i2:167-673(+)